MESTCFHGLCGTNRNNNATTRRIVDAMAKTDKYFQFLLKAIRLDKALDEVTVDNANERLNEIIKFCVMDVGRKQRAKFEEQDFYNMAFSRLEINYPAWYETTSKISMDQALMLNGATIIGVNLGSIDAKSFCQAERFIIAITGGETMCRIKSNLFFDVRDNECLTWRQFAVLCAVYAGIGRHKKKRLSFKQLSAMALGFTGPTEFRKITQTYRKIKSVEKRLLTDRQVRWTIDRLRERKFFAKTNVNKRHNWYSHAMSEAELDEAVLDLECRKHPRTDREKSDALQAKLQQMIQERDRVQ